MAPEGNTARPGRGGGCGLALGRLVRKLRRWSRMLCSTPIAAGGGARQAAARCGQYDALSYARNFDGPGFGADDEVSAGLYHYTLASRFVLAGATSPGQPQ